MRHVLEQYCSLIFHTASTKQMLFNQRENSSELFNHNKKYIITYKQILLCISRSSGLAKTPLHVHSKGKRRKGRQKKRWEDYIKEWTGMDFASSTKVAEDRTRWKGIVVKSPVVPQ